MRYLTATIGAIFIFAAVIIVGLGVNMFLPPGLQKPIPIDLGLFTFAGPPSLLIAAAIAPFAALHSFRSTLKRYAKKAAEENQSNSRGQKTRS